MSIGTNLSPKSTAQRKLAPIISSRYALKWQHAVVAGWFAFAFAIINHLPLGLSSNWWHASQGMVAMGGRSLDTVPFSPLAEGMPYIHTSWLSDVTMALGFRFCGIEFFAAAMAVLSILSAALWFHLCWREARQKRYALLASVVLFVVWSFGFSALRPQVFAGVLLPLLMWVAWPRGGKLKTASSVNWAAQKRWVAIFAIMEIWANVDVSFFLGIIVLACLTLGLVVERLRDQGLRLTVADSKVPYYVLVFQSAIIATLLSPAGAATWQSVLRMDSRGPLWNVAGGEYGLRITTASGLLFSLLVAFVVLVWQVSRYRKPLRDVFLFIAVVVATALNPINLFWLAPVAAFLAARHCGSLLRASSSREFDSAKPKSQEPAEHHSLMFVWSLVCLLLIWFGFAFSPISSPLLSANPRPFNRVVNEDVPSQVSDFLGPASRAGKIWAPADWSDWLIWSGERDLFCNSRLSFFPAVVQRDYAKVFQGNASWEEVTKRYDIRTIVVDKKRQAKLAKEVAISSRWKLVHETDRSLVVFLREAKS